MRAVKIISESTGALSTLFAVVGMSAATGMWAWRPEQFTSSNWLSAFGTCAGLIAAVIGKRLIDNTKLARNGVGEERKP